MVEDKLFAKVLQNAYRISGKYVSNHEDRQDLAQIVSMKFYLNRDNITEGKEDNWLYTTTKNAAADLYKDRKKTPQINLDFEKIEDQITKNIMDTSQNDDPSDILKEYEKEISKTERELLTEYARASFQIKKLAKRKKTSYESLKKKIYRLKADIRAKHNLKKGMLGTRKIFGAKLNENLLNFFNKFKKALEKNSLDSMSIYFRDCKIPEEYPKFDIHKVHGYDVQLRDDDKYQIFFYYFEPDESFKSVITTIQVYNRNAIKIVEFPRLPSRIREIEIKKDDLPDEVVEMLQYNEKGVPKLSKEDLQKLLDKHGLKTIDHL